MKPTPLLLTCLIGLAVPMAGLAQPTLQFSAASYTVAESAGAVTLTVQRTGETNTPVSVDFATADGTATNGLKYTAVSGTLTFGASETNKVVVVPILNNGLVDGTKNFRVILSNPTGGAVLGTRTNVPVSITDNDVGIQFQLATVSVSEDAGAALIGVVRGDDGTNAVTVDYATTNLTATSGVDYTGVTNTLSFAAGETMKLVTVPILNDGLKEANETFRITLTNPTGGGVLGVQKTATVTILDNDPGVQFEFVAYSVAEDAGSVLIGVVRGNDVDLPPFTVDYATADVAATSGADYTGVTNTLSFAAGETVKLFTVPILSDGLKEANETFRITLTNPTGGGVLGAQKTATVTILDNDPGFQFELASYAVAEDAGVARIGVLRGTDDTNSPVTVDFATTDLTATNGLEYTGSTNTLSFAPGEKLKLLRVPILNDGVKESSKTFRVTLSNPTGGAVLGSRTTVNVTIADNDPGLGFEVSSNSVWENAGAIIVTVLRGNDMALGPITVDYATSNLTAQAGQDYQTVSGTVAFLENETIKTIPIPILRNGLVTNDTSFQVTLSNPTGGATLGTASTTVNIMNAPEPGTFRVVAPLIDTALSIQREGDVNLLTWSGGGQLQRADRPTGPWQALTSVIIVTNPSSQTVRTVQSPLTTTFYRVTHPRPVNVYIPSSYNGQTPMPFVINLHGFGVTGADAEAFHQFRPLAEARGFLYCYPDGVSNQWNDGNLHQGGVDDAGYLRAVIEEVGRQFAVDRKRVHVFGYSNGGFMAYRMACDSADLIAGIASGAGVTFLDTNRCQPSQPVNILHAHGTADGSVPYVSGAVFPGAMRSIQIWAGYNGATGPVTDPGTSMDLDLNVPGLDTVVTRYTDAPPGGAVELWTIIGGAHQLDDSPEYSPRIIDWLLAHPKP